jgi:hypothetical protein
MAIEPPWVRADITATRGPLHGISGCCCESQLGRSPRPQGRSAKGTGAIRIPKILSDTAVGIQTADNEPVTDVDLTDTFINAAVRTISGQQGVAIQLLDQSPIAFDEIIFRDLTDAVAVKRVQGHRGRPRGRHEPDRSHPGGRPGGDQLRRSRATSPGPASRVRGWPCSSPTRGGVAAGCGLAHRFARLVGKGARSRGEVSTCSTLIESSPIGVRVGPNASSPRVWASTGRRSRSIWRVDYTY